MLHHRSRRGLAKRNSTAIPRLNRTLIEALRAIYPQKRYEPNSDLSTIMFMEGQRSVVDKLEAELRKQEERGIP